MAPELVPSKLHAADLGRTASVGLKTRRLRAVLSALGIMIGIASMVAILGLSESSKSDLLAQLDQLGTNLLTVRAGQGIGVGSGELPEEASRMIARIGPVEATSTVSEIDANVFRNELIPSGQTGGVTVQSVDTNLLETLGGTVASGRFLNDATAAYPNAVVGSVAAERLGIRNLDAQPEILVGGVRFSVVGVLDEFVLSPDLDRAVLVGIAAADTYLGHDPVPTTIHVRTDPTRVDSVTAVLSATTNPQNPEEVEISRPSDALEAREAVDDAFTSLFLGLGAVALIVGGVGIANVMVISVLERRSEIGLRRALGATKAHIRVQFLGEALLLATFGGLGGVAVGWLVTTAYSSFKGWETLVPTVAIVGGLGAAFLIGAVAGLYPAVRAARLSPTEALRSA